MLQGSSYKKVVFDLTEVPTRKHHLAYVGISRVTNLSGLYLVGFNERYIQTNPNTKREMTRLRFNFVKFVPRKHTVLSVLFGSRLAENAYQWLIPDISRIDQKTIIYNNARSLKGNHQYVMVDENMLHADVLIFSESRLSARQAVEFQIDNFSFTSFTPENPG